MGFIFDGNVGDIVYLNGRKYRTDESCIKELYSKNSDDCVYEVIRCIDKVLLFLDDHLDRFENSCKRYDLVSKRETLNNELYEFIDLIGLKNGNIKLIQSKEFRIIFHNKHYYPDDSVYLAGIVAGILNIERPDPNSKVLRSGYIDRVAEKLNSQGMHGKYFETLLMDSNGNITEGSRTNVFFVKGKTVYTAPGFAVLKGITRKYIIKAIENAELYFEEKFITGIQATSGDYTCFLSGTSIGVLPVKYIETTCIDSQDSVEIMKIREEYEKIVAKNVELQ